MFEGKEPIKESKHSRLGFIESVHEHCNTANAIHYENIPIQIYWKFYYQKMKIFR